MCLLNFLIICILFHCRQNFFSIYTSESIGSFVTPGLDTCTILAMERKQGLQCYSEGALGHGVYIGIRADVHIRL